MRATSTAFLAIAASLASCTGRSIVRDDASALSDAFDDVDDGTAPDAAADVPPGPACNPLGFGDPCVAPFPSAYYEEPDTTRASGMRVALASEALPATRGGIALDPAPWNRLDGFSPSGPFLVVFPERIDAATLVPPSHLERSIASTSATLVVDMETGELVPHLSEVDITVTSPSQRQAVILRPAQRLRAAHRYAIAVTRRARTVDGGEPSTPPGFAALRDGVPSADTRLARVRDRYDSIFSAIERAGVSRADLLVAWDVVTSSEDSLTGTMLSMRDQAFASVGDRGLGLTVTRVDDDFDATIERRVQGTFRVPLFLASDTPDARLARDANDRVTITTVIDVPFVAMIPRSARTATGPLPILMFGHGLFGSTSHEFGDATTPDEYLQRLANDDGFVIFGTDWIGLTQDDLGRVVEALGNVNLMTRTTDHLHQALINAMVLFRTARGRFATEPAFAIDGRGVVDASRAYFLGISLGAIMGTSFMGYDPDCDRAALNVFGGVWSTLFQRSDGWAALRLAFSAYPRATDQQVLLALTQSVFDPVDPINLAPHLLTDRLAGVGPRHLLFQQAVGDSAVTNVASEVVARTMGIPLLTPSVRTPFGAIGMGAPLESGWVIVDEMPTPLPPETNGPTQTNPTHVTMRREPAVREQIRRFLRPGGLVEQTCDGVCDPN
jgi:hypothetical protein